MSKRYDPLSYLPDCCYVCKYAGGWIDNMGCSKPQHENDEIKITTLCEDFSRGKNGLFAT
jgi:hypothetical protein